MIVMQGRHFSMTDAMIYGNPSALDWAICQNVRKLVQTSGDFAENSMAARPMPRSSGMPVRPAKAVSSCIALMPRTMRTPAFSLPTLSRTPCFVIERSFPITGTLSSATTAAATIFTTYPATMLPRLCPASCLRLETRIHRYVKHQSLKEGSAKHDAPLFFFCIRK